LLKILVRIHSLVVILVIKHFNIGFLNDQCFNYHRAKYLCLTDTFLNNINLNINVNLLNDNINYNRNNIVENRTENNINN